ncbi:MAG: hypothetical protein WCG80_00890 [Spirochaetales bacterium]
MSAKGDRLRDFLRERKETPPGEVPKPADWEALLEAAELTPDDLALYQKQVAGHKARALRAAEAKLDDEFVFEALQALLLAPFDLEFRAAVDKHLNSRPWIADDLAALRERLTALGRAKSQTKVPWLWLALLGGALLVVLSVLALFWWSPWSAPAGLTAPPVVSQSNRDLKVTLDTQGVKFQTTRLEAQLQVYAESEVLGLHVLLEFPNSRVQAWSAKFIVMDTTGAVVHQEDLELRAKREAPLEAGQGWQYDRQFDAVSWGERADSILIQTVAMEAANTDPKTLIQLPVAGKQSLTGGHEFQVYQVSSEWKQRFASQVNLLSLEFRNTGLKSFQALKLRLDWYDADGRRLKTLSLPVLSEYRAELPSGGHVALQPATEFESEVFSWPAASPPHPVLTLESWK